MNNVTHQLVLCEKPKGPLVLNTPTRRTRQLDGKLVNQYFTRDGFPQAYNTDGKNWWKIVVAIRRRDGHVCVFA